jgi:acetyl-CoA synthetase (ADP-forming)
MQRYQSLTLLEPSEDAWEIMVEKDDCSIILEKALMEKRCSLLIDEAQRICNLHHIPTPKSSVVSNADEAVEKANEIGYPVVLKIISPQITHKTDVGGVILNIGTEKELKIKYEKLVTEVRSREPSVTISGVMVEKMMPPSVEVVVGGIRDKQFGPAVMFGIGGILMEVYDDVVFRVAPVDRINVLNMIHGLRGSIMLEGVRGKPPLDLDAVASVLIGVSGLMVQHDAISQLDLNPVIAYPNGACAVDSRIILTQGGA